MSKIDKAIEYAEQLGREHGTNAAAWWEQGAIGGRNTRPDSEIRRAAQRVLDGIVDLAMDGYEVTFVTYHSRRWDELVEQGWITADVRAGVAKMVREARHG